MSRMWLLSKLGGCVASAVVIVLGGAGLSGCGGSDEPFPIVDVSEGTYLRGAQRSELDVAPGTEVARAELYLDRQRVAEADFAPFALAWDTRDFDDGAHQLLARLYDGKGGSIDHRVSIWIDNTPPTVGAIATTAEFKQYFRLQPSDNLLVDRVVVTGGNQEPLEVRHPFSFAWPFGCGVTAIQVQVFDAAGNETTASVEVTGAGTSSDSDCDGFIAAEAGGPDCDDRNANSYPGSPEFPEGFDLNCDGQVSRLDGWDNDGDGVLSISDGGSDCNDLDPLTHGDFFVFAELPVRIGGVPVSWNRGEGALLRGGAELVLQRGSAIDLLAPSFTGMGDMTVQPIATGANPGSLYVDYSLVTFGRASKIVVMRRDSVEWSTAAEIPANGAAGKLAQNAYEDDHFAVAYQAGTKLWLVRGSGTTWSTELVADLGEPLVQNPTLYANADYAGITVRLANEVRSYYRVKTDTQFTSSSLSPIGRRVSAMANTLLGTVIAVDQGSGSALYINGDTQLFVSPRRITAIAEIYPSILVSFESGGAQALSPRKRYRDLIVVQELPSIVGFDTDSPFGLAGRGALYSPTTGTVRAANDPPGGADQNCDGLN